MSNPYKSGQASKHLYKEKTVDAEVDLREEFEELLKTDARDTWFLYRKIRVDESGNPVKHPDIFDNRSGEMPRDVLSRGSTNNGNMYDDYMVRGYLNHSQAYSITNRFKDAGESKPDYKTFYLDYNFLEAATGVDGFYPSVFDKIIQVRLDKEGNVLSPLKVFKSFDILSVDPYRLDSSGRIEYYRFRLISVIDESFRV